MVTLCKVDSCGRYKDPENISMPYWIKIYVSGVLVTQPCTSEQFFEALAFMAESDQFQLPVKLV